ncbi:hypothetical protein DL96DRAFT_587735 [Flagelloscypha sp. PMI_526]|nr:hypothetical protein DL96DRAFT_587735 [Flagelloscypha sp. PMI_526]
MHCCIWLVALPSNLYASLAQSLEDASARSVIGRILGSLHDVVLWYRSYCHSPAPKYCLSPHCKFVRLVFQTNSRPFESQSFANNSSSHKTFTIPDMLLQPSSTTKPNIPPAAPTTFFPFDDRACPQCNAVRRLIINICLLRFAREDFVSKQFH